MPTQTGTIDLRSGNAIRLYTEQGFSSLDEKYVEQSEIDAKADEIRGEVRKEIYELDENGEPTSTARWVAAITESAASITSSVEGSYATKSDLDAEVTARTTFQQSTDGFLATISRDYATKDEVATLVRAYGDGVLVCKKGQTVGALVNADGSFDVVTVSWEGEDGGTPNAMTQAPLTHIAGDVATFGSRSGAFVAIETVEVEDTSGQVSTTRQLGFYDGTNPDNDPQLVAYMRNGLFYVANTMVLHTMRVGEDDPTTQDVTEGWEWKYQSTGSTKGNMSLKWVG